MKNFNIVVQEKDCCCRKLWAAIKNTNEIPINLELGNFPCGIEFNYSNELQEDYFKDLPYDMVIDYCPFCGKKISVFKTERSGRWKKRKRLCEGIVSWFDVDKKQASQINAFEYDHRNNQFYVHKRKGFGNGLIPIEYCICCGEPLSRMVELYGLPDSIKLSLHSDEWWKKRGL